VSVQVSPEFREAVDAFQRGDLDGARTVAERATASEPSPQWHHLLGLINCRQGDARAGIEHLRIAVDAEPGNAAFKLMLMRALIDAGRADEALAMPEPPAIGSAAELALWQARAEAAEKASSSAAAAAAWQRIAAALPGDHRHWVNAGRSLLRLERFEEAEAAYGRALAISPADADAVYELGLLYERTNRLEELRTLLEQAMKNGLTKERLPYLWALHEQRQGHFDAARTLLSLPGAEHDPIRWNRLRARLADEAGDSRQAFEASEAMNRAIPDYESWRSRGRAYRQKLRDLAAAVTPDWAAALPRLEEAPARTPAFLVGFPRSGTTLLDTFLMGHPNVVVLEELPLLFTMADPVDLLPRIVGESTDTLHELREAYLAALETHASPAFGGLVIDKFPLNMVAAPLIHALFPGAPILFAQRHPCDAVLSGFMQSFTSNLGMASFLDIADSADFYDSAMLVWTKAREILPLNVQTVVYEELVSDPEAALRPTLDFLGLPWEPAVLDHRSAARARGTIGNTSYSQVVEPLSRRAVGRWRRYKQQLGPVLPRLLPWAERLGYSG
jgi:tetratricopeptide (TPR) repeat protein